MSRWRRIGLTVSAMLAVLVLTMGYRLALSRGLFNSVEESAPGLCRAVPGIGPVADIATAGGKTFIATSAALYAYGDEKFVTLTGTPKAFDVRALAAFVRGDTVLLRAVLAQEEGRYSVVLLKVTGAAAQDVGRLTTDVMTEPTALAMPDAERFYFVNRHDSKTGLGRWLDDVLLLPRGHLQWFDGMKFAAVAEGLNTSSGLALSADGTKLFAAEEYPRRIVSMNRNDFNGAIDNPSAMTLPAGPRKLTLASDGSLIVAARPKAGAGEVWRVRLENGVPKTSEKLYASQSTITAAAAVGGTLLVGTDKQLLACALPQ